MAAERCSHEGAKVKAYRSSLIMKREKELKRNSFPLRARAKIVLNAGSL